MKKTKKFLRLLILLTLILLPTVTMSLSGAAAKSSITKTAATTTTKPEENLTADDWKIELDESTQSGNKEFDFIQNNLASSDLADNGQFLLICGFALVVLAAGGVVFFTFCLYKLCKNTKKREQMAANRRHKNTVTRKK